MVPERFVRAERRRGAGHRAGLQRLNDPDECRGEGVEVERGVLCGKVPDDDLRECREHVHVAQVVVLLLVECADLRRGRRTE